MADVGEVRAKMVLESGDWESGFARVVGVVTGAEASINTGIEAIKGQVAGVGQAVQAAGDAVEGAADKLSLAQAVQGGVALLTQFSGAIEGFRAELNRAGDASDDLADHLRGAFGDAADAIAKASEQEITLGFKPEEIAQVQVTLQKFSANTVENLKLVEDAAVATGKPLEGLAQAFGRLAEATDEKGAKGAIKALQAELGASTLELQQFGAKLDENNKLLIDTPARLQAAKDAVVAFSQANFAGAAERAADETTRLAGELELLKRSIGSNVTAFKESFSPALRVVVQDLQALPDGVKSFIGVGSQFVSVGATMASTTLQIGANIVLLASNATISTAAINAMTAATVGLNIAIAASVLGFASAAAGLALIANGYNQAKIQAEELAQVELRRSSGLTVGSKFIGKTAEEVRALGGDAKQVARLIDGLQEELQKSTGSKADELKAQIADAIKVKGELATQNAKAKEAAKGDINAPSDKESAKADRDRKKAADQAERDQKKKDRDAESSRKDALAGELAIIHEQASAREISKAQEIQALQEVALSNRANAKEKRAIELEISRLKGQIRAEEKSAEDKKNAQAVRDAAKTAREAAQAKRKAEAEEKAAQKKDDTQQKVDTGKIQASGKQKSDAEKKILDEQIKTAQDTAEKTHKSTLPIIAEALKKKLDLTIQEINKERDLAVAATENESVKVAAVDAAEARVREARAESTRALLDETEKQKKALQSVIDKTDEAAKPKGLTITGGVQSVEEFAKESQAREAATLARRDEIRKGNATANPAFTPSIFGLTKPSAAEKTTVAKQPESPTTPAQQMATALAEIIKGQPIAITIENNFPGEAKQSKTFSGPVGTLEKAKSVFNAKHALGAP